MLFQVYDVTPYIWTIIQEVMKLWYHPQVSNLFMLLYLLFNINDDNINTSVSATMKKTKTLYKLLQRRMPQMSLNLLATVILLRR